MGQYIQINSPKGKANFLIKEKGAIVLPFPMLSSDPMITVCVVDNGLFEAAAVIDSERELEAFEYPCGRPKVWLTVPKNNIVYG